MTKRVDDLVGAVCGPGDHPLAAVLRGWCQGSRPFLAFAEAHAAKIRKKVRLAATEATRADLLAELGLAARLLQDPRFELVYEPVPASGGRGPDFLVRFRTHPAGHAEVTRLRPGGADLSGRLARVLVDKVQQLPPGGANLLAVAVPDGAASETLVPDALKLLERASRPPEPLPPGLPAGGGRTYFRQRPRLSAVALLSLAPDGQTGISSLWLNPQARHPLPPELVRALGRPAE